MVVRSSDPTDTRSIILAPSDSGSVMDPIWQQVEGTPQTIVPLEFVQDLEARVDWHRQIHGLSPLQSSDVLAHAARHHGERMRDMHFFAHDDPFDRSDPIKRVRRFDKSLWLVVAENIAAGQWAATQVMQGWLNSPGHRANVERAGLDAVGTAVVLGGEHRSYTVQLYAKSGRLVPRRK